MLLKSILLLSACASLAFTAPASHNHALSQPVKLLRPIRHDGEMIVRYKPSKKVIAAAAKLHLDVWARDRHTFSVRVTPAQYRQLQKSAGKGTIIDNNIQTSIDKETAQLNSQLSKGLIVAVDPSWHTAYHQYTDIVTWLQQLASKYSNLVTYTASIGKSVEGRDIPMLKITSQNNAGSKKSIFFQGLQHAREWIAGAVMQYVADYLASNYGSDSTVTSLLDQIEFTIIPVANPDGYDYSWNGDRLWRKNRSLVDGSAQGVDMNRNWPDHWNDGGSSTDPSDDTYMGSSAASEPEVQALMAAYQATPNIILGCDFHSFSQLILRPYGWTTDNSPDDAAFTTLGQSIMTSMATVSSDQYVNERIVDLYVASGGANDWWYGIGTPTGTQKPYGIAIELPPDANSDENGFILDPSQIVPVSESMVQATLAMAQYALANPLGPQSQLDN